MKKEGLDFDHGTVVVWVNPDRLTYNSETTPQTHDALQINTERSL
jgi:hypothetical protein